MPEIVKLAENVMLYCGECEGVLPTLDPVSAVVTDPPYGLSFMGKAWDYDIPGADTWAAVLRALRPGGHLLAFAGTRTQHRMACAIEDAGFEIRDLIAWVYGCLSDDTEILVEGRWERFNKSIEGKRVLCYIPEHDEYQWQTVQETIEYEYNDTAYHIQGDFTDQIVSRNHRCLVKRGGEYVFQLAETLQREAHVPILENMQDLLESVPLQKQGTSCEKSILFEGMRAKESREEKTIIGTKREDCFMRNVRCKNLEARCLVEKKQKSILFKKMQRGRTRESVDPFSSEWKGETSSGHRIKGRKKSCMERRGYFLRQKRELQKNKVCEMSGGIYGDVSKRWICNGTQIDCCESHKTLSIKSRGCSPQKSQSARQPTGKFGIVRQQSRSQTIRGKGFTKSDLAIVSPVHYVGRVWCVRVPSGAFVARRKEYFRIAVARVEKALQQGVLGI